MGVQIFRYAQDYKNWLDYNESDVTVVSVVVFDDNLVVTYQRK